MIERRLTCAPVESSRVGVMKALVDRTVTLRSHEGGVVEVCRYAITFHMTL